MCCERALGFGNGVGCSAGVLEHDEELVATMVDDMPFAALHGLPEKAPVLCEHDRVAVAQRSYERRRALHIGEDECDCSMGEIGCQSLLQGDLGPDAGSRTARTVDRELPVQRRDAVGQPAQA
jgi:hypothetical protein